jgi:hypothetical protein
MGLKMSYIDCIEDIKKLSHYREYICSNCGYKQTVYILIIQKDCEKCGEQGKLRRYESIGAETEDIIDAVLDWLGKGKEFKDAMDWKRLRDAHTE